MAKKFFHVQIGDTVRKYEEGTTYRQIAEEFQTDYQHDIVLAFVDERLQELFKTVQSDLSLIHI